MKTIKQTIVVCAISVLFCFVTGCQNVGPDEILKDDNFLNEHMAEFESATSELTSLTVVQGQMDKSKVEVVLNNLKEAGYVEKAEILDDYVHVEYTNGLILDYPVIPNEIFVPDSPAEDGILSMTNSTKAVYDDYDAYVFDGSEVGERKAQHKLVINIWKYLLNMGLNRGYARGNDFTTAELEKVFRSPNIRYVIVSSHGYSGLVITGECIPASQFKGISGNELKIAMKQNRLVDIGTKRNGEHMYNKVWDPTYINNLPGASDKFVYFTGCSIMTEYNKEQFDKFYNGIVAGWDGTNVIGEAVGYCLTDALKTKTFKTFMGECDVITDYDHDSHFTYAGKMSDFSLLPNKASTFLPYAGKNSKINKPAQFQRVKPFLGVSAFNFSFSYDKDEYGGASVSSRKGPKFYLSVLDVLDNEVVYETACLGTIGGTWFEIIPSDASAVFKVRVERSLDGGETYSEYQVRYALISNKFEKNCVEGEDGDMPDVATFGLEQEDGSFMLFGRSFKYKNVKYTGFCYYPVGSAAGESIDGTGSPIFTATLSGLQPNTEYCAYAYVVDEHDELHMGNMVYFNSGNVQPTPSEAVDMGLSVKWATCNLGASKPEEYGGYYQWAGIEDVTNTSIYLDYSNCPYHTGSRYSPGWTKYIPSGQSSYWSGTGSPDNKTVLDPDDDVAHVNMGGKWRMPTEAEFQELIDNCTSECTTLNGVKGRKFTSKKNGNSIFLPAAGFRCSDFLDYDGSYGYYWSSSLDTDDPSNACGMSFSYGDVYTGNRDRYFGRSVRPVYDEGISGQAVISVSPEEVEFGKVYPGESATASFTITNTGTATAYVSITNPSDFVTSDVSGDISISGAGGSKTVKLTFTPKEKGSYGGRILVSCGGTDINVLYEGTCIEKNNDAPEAVDLGLPSGLKWATCNLGASKPEEYGGYYQWTGLQDVTDTSIYLDWDNCPYHTGSSPSTGWTKYVPSNNSSYWSGSGSPDNKTVLDPEDDVAHVKWGGKWRMPTDAEFQELIDNCTSEWTTLNGVKGRKFTSKKNGNSIFLPAAGYRYLDSLNSIGSPGYYWSSSLNTDHPSYAYYMYFSSGNVFTDSDYRRYGRSVRPVLE